MLTSRTPWRFAADSLTAAGRHTPLAVPSLCFPLLPYPSLSFTPFPSSSPHQVLVSYHLPPLSSPAGPSFHLADVEAPASPDNHPSFPPFLSFAVLLICLCHHLLRPPFLPFCPLQAPPSLPPSRSPAVYLLSTALVLTPCLALFRFPSLLPSK